MWRRPSPGRGGDILPGSMSTHAGDPPAGAAGATPEAEAAPVKLQLPVEGMTCASCVNRIERFLKRTPGVTDATVNLATEIATIRYLPEQAGRAELVGAIQAAGSGGRERARAGGATPVAAP